jgi:hypothetical protein
MARRSIDKSCRILSLKTYNVLHALCCPLVTFHSKYRCVRSSGRSPTRRLISPESGPSLSRTTITIACSPDRASILASTGRRRLGVFDARGTYRIDHISPAPQSRTLYVYAYMNMGAAGHAVQTIASLDSRCTLAKALPLPQHRVCVKALFCVVMCL